MTSFVKFWIWVSALASAAGWTLSVVGQLNRVGYSVFALVTLAGWFWIRQSEAKENRPERRRNWRRFRRRFRHWLPLSFSLLALLVLLGGILYAPSNHTGLSYRVPRVLHWLAEGQWHWIHTPNYRMNNRACGMEWLSAPLLLFLKSDRGLFLLNFLPFLMLPGLIFSLFTRLGVRARVAWHWMWLLPTGYTFLVQAGSIANDTFPTVYALAALDFALRARVSRRASDVMVSVLAAALLTGAKASNLPLLLPWAIALLGLWPRRVRMEDGGWTMAPRAAADRHSHLPSSILHSPSSWIVPPGGRPAGQPYQRRLVAVGVTTLLALVASFLPTAILNVVYCGDWSGLVLERSGMDMKNPVVGVWGNALLLLSNNLVPPFFPMANWYTHSILTLLPGFIVEPMTANFEQGFQQLWELPTEDWTGLGFGVTGLLAVAVVAALRRDAKLNPPPGSRVGPTSRSALPAALPADWMRGGVLLGSWVALLAYCVKSGMVTPARLISPYYPLLTAPLLLWAGHSIVVRRRWWRYAEVAAVVMAFGVLIVTPARPLWPAQTVLSRATGAWPEHSLIGKAARVYSVYATRSDPLADVRAQLPREATAIGFIGTGDDLDISFWRPLGSRRVRHFTLDDPADFIRRQGVEYVVVGGLNLRFENKALDSWLEETGGERIATVTAVVKVNEGPQAWHIVRLR